MRRLRVPIILLGVLIVVTAPVAAAVGVCDRTAATVQAACARGADQDYFIATGNCLNGAHSRVEAAECRADAREERAEALEECGEIYDAYLEACDLLGQDAYDPVIDPDNFDAPVQNPYFPLVPGTTYVYEGMTSDGLERVETTVTHDTVEILGVECIVVRDVEMLNGDVVEDTQDWYAMDNLGNVWYFGELSFEVENGEIVGIDGSWKAGVDGAKPGIIMLAAPHVGDVYRQEFFLTEAEDIGEVLDLNGSAMVPYGDFNGTLVIRDFTPLEPEANEHKHWAFGVGLVLELDLEDDERVELVDIQN